MDIAMDLGTSRTRILTSDNKKILDEPSVIAYYTVDGSLAAIGTKAEKMLGKTPPSMEAVCPLAGGVIAHSSLVEEMVYVFMKKICTNRVIMPRVVACIPEEITEVEKRAAVNAISSFGVRRVYLIECTKAAAMGAGMNIKAPHGNMVADIGAGTADIAVISLDGVSVSRSVKTAGDTMDEDIIKYVKKNFNLYIGSPMAKHCKETIGNVFANPEKEIFILKGRDSVTGLPSFAEINSIQVKEAIHETADAIVKGILDVLEETPPELIGDIHTDGIVLTGGLSKLKGFAELVKRKTGIEKVVVADEPDECVVKGCAMAIASIPDVENRNASEVNPLIAAY